MDKVILYKSRRSNEPIVFDASTDEKKEEAYRQLFGIIDEHEAAFHFSTRSQEEKLERLQDPEVEYENSVMVETQREGYVEKLPKDKWNKRIEHAKDRIEAAEKKQQIYESAKGGNIDSIRKLLDIMKGQPYVDFHELEIQN